MHELAVAESLLKIVKDECKKHGLSRVTQVRLRIGRLSTVVPEALSFSFEVIAKGTLAEGAQLSVEVVPVMAHCGDCKMDLEIDSHFFLCPQCGGVLVALVSGKELEIVDIEGE
ncbi:MAG: hydrogenase maturation nickel metallochaperone HypA [Deltaproteobacteria bacterium]|nr:hydrogenase maturation nickel metallochaperone HypA [Deltaproteobacteria bacterium]MBW2073433.1 hydrogenase maturation nickel metallochaperone HypA [Deltaproteobacteria bacterium]RLB83989.1 MAG: hydrogenase maturation nickel metallochaperone HypA [Deltaproteobacteria bacterium]